MALPGFRALGTSQRWAARFSGTSCTDGLFVPATDGNAHGDHAKQSQYHLGQLRSDPGPTTACVISESSLSVPEPDFLTRKSCLCETELPAGKGQGVPSPLCPPRLSTVLPGCLWPAAVG